MDRTFLLGVGAQKAGTTWLHQTLAAVPKVNFGVRKEYHIWDVLSSDLFKNLRVTAAMVQDGMTDAAIRYRMQNESGYYAHYFNTLLDSGCRLTGDITPSYSALSSDDWIPVREVLHLIDAKLRVVFLLRDPFERCWSAVRMGKRFKNLTGSDDALLQRLYASPEFEVRTRYDRTVRSLRATFPESALYFGLYETMHEEGELRRLSDFLGVTLPSGASDHRFNATPKVELVSEQTADCVRGFYQEVYDFCRAEFPACQAHWRF